MNQRANVDLSAPSFTHVLNPFPAKEGSEHFIASDITWRTLQRAVAKAHATGLQIDVRAIILRGDERAVRPPAVLHAYLERTVQDIATLRPNRLFPLIGDILQLGASKTDTTHVIFSNMDISVRPDFYLALRGLIGEKNLADIPFTIARRNIDPTLANGPLEAMYAADGPIGHGFDCFVIPRPLIDHLDLGVSCIGAPHFDLLLYIALDVASGHRVRSFNRTGLTFHLGCDIAWAAMINYVEYNLKEALSAIDRMKLRHAIRADSAFDRLEKGHFRPNATLTSALLRKVRRIPGLATAILHTKRALGRQF